VETRIPLSNGPDQL